MTERALSRSAVQAPTTGRYAGLSFYWSRSSMMVLILCGLVAVRIHEFFPFIGVVKPVLTGALGTFAVLVSRTHKSVQRSVTQSPLARMVFLYFAFVLASIPFGLYPGGSFDQARSLFPAILMFAAFLMTPPTRENLDRLQFGLVVLILFFAWYVQFFGGSWRGRLLSVSGSFDTNDIASIMCIGLPLAAGVLMRIKGTRERVGAALAILALVLGVIATGSRGGTLALCAAVFVFMVGLRGNARVVGPIIIVSLGGIFWVTAPPTFRARIKSLTNLENDYNVTTEAGRKAVWRRGRGYILDRPILGAGAGNFYIADGANKHERGMTGKWSAAHNAYLQAYVELGIPGGTVYILLLLTAAGIAIRMWGPERRRIRGPPSLLYRPEYLASLAGYSAGAYFLSHAYFTPFFALLGLIAMAQRVEEAERRGLQVSGDQGGEPAPVVVRLRGQRGGLAWARILPAPGTPRGGAVMRSVTPELPGRPPGIRGRSS